MGKKDKVLIPSEETRLESAPCGGMGGELPSTGDGKWNSTGGGR